MKKFISLAAAALLVFFLSTCARRPEEPEPDYLGMMMQAAQREMTDLLKCRPYGQTA